MELYCIYIYGHGYWRGEDSGFEILSSRASVYPTRQEARLFAKVLFTRYGYDCNVEVVRPNAH